MNQTRNLEVMQQDIAYLKKEHDDIIFIIGLLKDYYSSNVMDKKQRLQRDLERFQGDQFILSTTQTEKNKSKKKMVELRDGLQKSFFEGEYSKMHITADEILSLSNMILSILEDDIRKLAEVEKTIRILYNGIQDMINDIPEPSKEMEKKFLEMTTDAKRKDSNEPIQEPEDTGSDEEE